MISINLSLITVTSLITITVKIMLLIKKNVTEFQIVNKVYYFQVRSFWRIISIITGVMIILYIFLDEHKY
jgi:hypothetical protein